MYNINYDNLKKGYKVYGLFLTIGIIMLVIFSCLLFKGAIKKLFMDSQVKAYNVHITKLHNTRAIYYYRVNGIEYEYTYIPSSNNPSIQKMTTKDTIYYNSEYPADCVAEYETMVKASDILVVLFLSIFPTVGINGIINVKKRIVKVKELAKNGTLTKGIAYRLVGTGTKVNGRRIMALQIDYTLPSGKVITLTSDPRYDMKNSDEDGLVDLLIDMDNPDNYYIDFNIADV